MNVIIMPIPYKKYLYLLTFLLKDRRAEFSEGSFSIYFHKCIEEKTNLLVQKIQVAQYFQYIHFNNKSIFNTFNSIQACIPSQIASENLASELGPNH